MLKYRSRGSSDSIVSDYGLDDRNSIPSSLCVQTSLRSTQLPILWEQVVFPRRESTAGA
jgi:hypothetical protein